MWRIWPTWWVRLEAILGGAFFVFDVGVLWRCKEGGRRFVKEIVGVERLECVITGSQNRSHGCWNPEKAKNKEPEEEQESSIGNQRMSQQPTGMLEIACRDVRMAETSGQKNYFESELNFLDGCVSPCTPEATPPERRFYRSRSPAPRPINNSPSASFLPLFAMLHVLHDYSTILHK